MNQDIYNPTEYWTPENLPNGRFLYDRGDGEREVTEEFVWNRLDRKDWRNAAEDFHSIVHYGIAFGKAYNYHGEYFQFFLVK